MTPSESRNKSQLLWFIACYSICLLALLSVRPLWLDELIDLCGIRNHSLRGLIAWVPLNAGGVPLNYLVRWPLLDTFGYSAFVGRLPSALFSVVACIGLWRIAIAAGLRSPLVCLLLLALMPLDLRYALESRPYSQALAITIWQTVLFLQLSQRPRGWGFAAYGLLVAAGLYSQPFSVFVPVAHFVWALAERRSASIFGRLALAIALGALSFAPWYVWAVAVWQQAQQSAPYAVDAHAPVLVLRELTGAGYVGMALLLTAAWIGFGAAAARRCLWVLLTVLPIVLALAADAIFGYFVAIRQTIYVLPALSLLAAFGLERLSSVWRAALGAALAIVFVVYDVRFLTKPGENWGAAASAMENRADCFISFPPDTIELYEFFAPELRHHACKGATPSVVALAVSPYLSDKTGFEMEKNKLRSTGYLLQEVTGLPQVWIFRRPTLSHVRNHSGELLKFPIRYTKEFKSATNSLPNVSVRPVKPE